MSEVWKTIEGYEGLYEVSSCGNVRRASDSHLLCKGSIMKQSRAGNEYLNINLCKNGICKRYLVHRLVAIAFIQNPHVKNCVNHINGHKHDNSVFNLEWVNWSENLLHSYQNGFHTGMFGVENPASKLTENEVKKIREMKGIISQRKLAKIYNVCKTTIGVIHRGERWAHI